MNTVLPLVKIWCTYPQTTEAIVFIKTQNNKIIEETRKKTDKVVFLLQVNNLTAMTVVNDIVDFSSVCSIYTALITVFFFF